MESNLNSELLFETLSEVLEDAAFIFTEVADESLQFNSDILKSSIHYNGQEDGILSLAVDKITAKTVAANLLGIEPSDEDAEEKSVEAVSEILNIVCGVFLERWLGGQNHCRLGIPSTVSLTAAEEMAALNSSRCNAILEDEEGNRIDIFVSGN
ncbi:MAG: chemotaxis protein CheX [Deltaproteobacteria bacterium]|nr:chemotaxis protein CheX [Deltaproteobacteria bacterium]